jgi:hypothetical protein
MALHGWRAVVQYLSGSIALALPTFICLWLGLGLRISRSFVESHGGRLGGVDNSSRGGAFHVTLPPKIEAQK